MTAGERPQLAHTVIVPTGVAELTIFVYRTTFDEYTVAWQRLIPEDDNWTKCSSMPYHELPILAAALLLAHAWCVSQTSKG